MMHTRLSCLLAVSLITAGCVSPVVHEGYRTRSYFGWTTVTEKLQANADPQVEIVKNVGVKIGQGLGLGYSEDVRVHLPMGCGVVIFVQNLDQLDQLFNVYPHLRQGDNPCIKPGAP